MQMRIVKKSTVDGGYGKLKWLIDISEYSLQGLEELEVAYE